MFVILHVQTPASIYSPDVLNVPLTTLVDIDLQNELGK